MLRVALSLAIAVGCGQRPGADTGAAKVEAAAPTAAPSRAPEQTATASAAVIVTAPAPAPAAPAPAPAAPAPTDDLTARLTSPAAVASRRERFARAVERISRSLGAPITAAEALAANPCGGWSGPGCSNLTFGLEAIKLVAPLAASMYDDRAADIAAVLVEAVTAHSIWHDAFGFVQTRLRLGPGYTYAGCLLSRCEAADFRCGQVDGLLYQVGRLLGALEGPECGPGCAYAD